MNQEIRMRISGWTKEAEKLQGHLLFAAEEGSPEIREQIIERLSPSDFISKTLRDRFSRLHDCWISRAGQTRDRDGDVGGSRANPDFHDMIQRLVRLVGAIRVMRLFSETSEILGADISRYDSLLENINKEVSARSRRLAALRVNPSVWKESKARTLEILCEIENFLRKKSAVAEDRIGWADIFCLDFFAGQFQPGRLYLLGARPGEGKTAFLSMLARAASLSKKRVGLIALRDTEHNIRLRILGGEAQWDASAIPHGTIGNKSMARLGEYLGKAFQTFPAISALHDPSTFTLCGLARELVAVKKPRLLMVDDIGFAFEGTDHPDRQAALMARIARLRDVARETNIPLLATVTLECTGAMKHLPGTAPTPEDVLRFSATDFLAVLTVTRNAEGDPIHEFEILQNPFGPTGKIPLVYHKIHQRFYEMADGSRVEEDCF